MGECSRNGPDGFRDATPGSTGLQKKKKERPARRAAEGTFREKPISENDADNEGNGERPGPDGLPHYFG